MQTMILGGVMNPLSQEDVLVINNQREIGVHSTSCHVNCSNQWYVLVSKLLVRGNGLTMH